MDIIDKLIKVTEQGKISWKNESEDVFVDDFYTTINNIRVGLHVDYNDYVDTNSTIEEGYYLSIEAKYVEYINKPKDKLKKLYMFISGNNKNTDSNIIKLLSDSLDNFK